MTQSYIIWKSHGSKGPYTICKVSSKLSIILSLAQQPYSEWKRVDCQCIQDSCGRVEMPCAFDNFAWLMHWHFLPLFTVPWLRPGLIMYRTLLCALSICIPNVAVCQVALAPHLGQLVRTGGSCRWSCRVVILWHTLCMTSPGVRWTFRRRVIGRVAVIIL